MSIKDEKEESEGEMERSVGCHYVMKRGIERQKKQQKARNTLNYGRFGLVPHMQLLGKLRQRHNNLTLAQRLATPIKKTQGKYLQLKLVYFRYEGV